MNNEETIIAQPQDNQQAGVNNPQQKKNSKSSNVGVAAAAVAGGAIFGGAGAAAAATYMHRNAEEDKDAENPEEQEVSAAEQAAAAVAPSAQPVHEEAPKEEVVRVVHVTEPAEHEQDYTNHQGADPVVQGPTAQTVSHEEETEDEVAVLGVYENIDENGVHQEAAVLTDGEEVAVVLDSTGDGEANQIWVDENLNMEVDEGEVYDISDQHVDMGMYEDMYAAQQMELEQQQETFAYNASDEQDYNNDAEVFDV